MSALSVGALYHPSRSSWPECTQYSYRAGAHELILFLRSPTDAEVKAARFGRAEFGLYVSGPLILLLHRFGDGLPWSDSPYSWHLVPSTERDLPSADLEREARANLNVILVDAATGIVRSIRLVSFTPAFTRLLHAAIRAQAAQPWDPGAYDDALAALYSIHRTTTSLLAVSSRCVGGS